MIHLPSRPAQQIVDRSVYFHFPPSYFCPNVRWSTILFCQMLVSSRFQMSRRAFETAWKKYSDGHCMPQQILRDSSTDPLVLLSNCLAEAVSPTAFRRDPLSEYQLRRSIGERWPVSALKKIINSVNPQSGYKLDL